MQAEERMDSTVTHRKTAAGKEKVKNEEKVTKEEKISENTEDPVENEENEENGDTSESKIEETSDPPKLRLQEDFTTWGTVKYKFYLFRWYHYYYADKLDKCLAAGCLWIMRMYFKFLGFVDAAHDVGDE